MGHQKTIEFPLFRIPLKINFIIFTVEFAEGFNVFLTTLNGKPYYYGSPITQTISEI